MGKGDKKTKRGKIWRGSFGKTRPRKGRKTGTAGVAEIPTGNAASDAATPSLATAGQ